MRSAMDLHLLPFLLGARSRNDLQHFIGDLLLSASAAVRLVDGRAFGLFFFFLLSIAQRIRSKPPPSHMKVLSFVRDVRTFEMATKVRNLYVAELRFAEKEYYSTQLCELTPERFSREPHRWWNKAKSICGINSKTHLPTLVVNGSSWSSSLDKAECLNSSFAQQCTASVMNPALPTETVPTVRKTFSFRLLDSDAVQKKLSSLNVWKSTGLDGFSNRLLKECAEVLSPPLAHVFNCSLQSGVFPTVWKQGLVSPVYKNKGSRSNPKNYRPITLLSCISKSLKVSSATNCSRTVCWTMLCPMSSLASCPSALLSGSFCQLSTSGKKLLIMAFSHTPAFWTWPRLLTE